MKSALTAALEHKDDGTTWKPKKLDKESFPCIYFSNTNESLEPK